MVFALARGDGGGDGGDVAPRRARGSKRGAQKPDSLLRSTQRLRPGHQRVTPRAPQQRGGCAVAGRDTKRHVHATGRVLPRLPRARGCLGGGVGRDGVGNAQVAGVSRRRRRRRLRRSLAEQRVGHGEPLDRGAIGRDTVGSVPQLRRGSGGGERLEAEPPILSRRHRRRRRLNRERVFVSRERRAQGAQNRSLQTVRGGQCRREGVHGGMNPVAASPLAGVGAAPRGEL